MPYANRTTREHVGKQKSYSRRWEYHILPKCHEEPSMIGVEHDTYIGSRGYMIAQGCARKKEHNPTRKQGANLLMIPFIFGMVFMPKYHNDSGRA